jgi:hypothetical protein
MRIKVLLAEPRLRRWHLGLLERLAARQETRVEVDVERGVAPPPSDVDRLFQIETRLHGLASTGLSERLPISKFAGFAVAAEDAADMVLDLRAQNRPERARAAWPTYDGALDETALVAAIVEKRTPVVEVHSADGVLARARPGSEHSGVVKATFEDMLARTITLILAALDAAASRELPNLPTNAPSPERSRPPKKIAVPELVARQLASKIVREVYRRTYHSPHWRVRWRVRQGPDLWDVRRDPDSGWTDLADDGSRFYADPFPIVHRGKLVLFVEDFEHRRGKGIISAVEIGPGGPLGEPRPVLECEGHLSYPFVFERDGAYWMVPESNSAGRIDLFRATDFPGGWVRETTLVPDVVASDATLVERDGLWWLFATVRDGGGAYSDTLHLWSATDFRGPWTAHPRNPVLIDIASARPAGRFVERDGVLYRPVQDCREGYGAALGLARVDRLDADGFAQTVETILRAGPGMFGRRLHTLNSAGGFEFIDGAALAPRWRTWRRKSSP